MLFITSGLNLLVGFIDSRNVLKLSNTRRPDAAVLSLYPDDDPPSRLKQNFMIIGW